jgi:hypothetical protein
LGATIVPLSLTNALLSFHAVEGEEYTIQFSPGLSFPMVWTTLFKVTATTPLATIIVPIVQGQTGFYRVVQTNDLPVEQEPTLTITQTSSNQIRIAWSTQLVGYRLQYSDDLVTPMCLVLLPFPDESEKFGADCSMETEESGSSSHLHFHWLS